MSEESVNRILVWVSVMAAAIIGRLMYHANEVRQGRRKFWSPALPVDLLIAVGMGVIGHALCVWLGVSGAVESGVVAVAGYLGPHGIDALFEWKFGKSEKKDR